MGRQFGVTLGIKGSNVLPKRPQGLIFCQIGSFTIHDKAAHEQI